MARDRFYFSRNILACLTNSLIYIPNLMLIRKRQFAAAPSQHPGEAG